MFAVMKFAAWLLNPLSLGLAGILAGGGLAVARPEIARAPDVGFHVCLVVDLVVALVFDACRRWP